MRNTLQYPFFKAYYNENKPAATWLNNYDCYKKWILNEKILSKAEIESLVKEMEQIMQDFHHYSFKIYGGKTEFAAIRHKREKNEARYIPSFSIRYEKTFMGTAKYVVTFNTFSDGALNFSAEPGRENKMFFQKIQNLFDKLRADAIRTEMREKLELPTITRDMKVR